MRILKSICIFLLSWLVITLLFVAITAFAIDTSNSAIHTATAFMTILGTPVLATLVTLSWWKRDAAKESQNKDLEFQRASQTEEAHRNFLRRRFVERERLIDTIDRHRTALVRNLDRAIKKNDYGAITSDTTEEALIEFFASINLDHAAIAFDEASHLVFEQLNFRRSEEIKAGFRPDQLPFDGHEFERWVADSLISFGWTAEVTRASGDQGIDVIAIIKGKSVGIQCKLYNTPIGNKAIQEAHAGKMYHSLDVVAVLTNAGFTSSARDLASATGVHLLSHHDIPDLEQKLFP